jgi:hypothetical protein
MPAEMPATGFWLGPGPAIGLVVMPSLGLILAVIAIILQMGKK